MDALAVAAFLSVVNTTIVDYLVRPIKAKYPNVDMWWMVYVSLFTGGVFVWFSQVNLFGSYLPDPLVGRILTAIVAGGGSNLLYRVFNRDQTVIVNNSIK